MRRVEKRVAAEQPAECRLSLPFELRQRSRLRATTSAGDEVALVLERGKVLRDGEKLQDDQGRVIQVVAAPELVSEVRCDNPWLLTKAAYHLGNRHVPLQLGKGFLRYLHDHVLDEMLQGFGLTVICHRAPFEPEEGAYAQGHHPHVHAPAQGAEIRLTARAVLPQAQPPVAHAD